MKNNYSIEHATQQDMSLIIEWAAREGWNPGYNDKECFYCADPQGFLVGRLNGQTIAVISSVAYDEQFSFCGLYIVDTPWRGQGYGILLFKAAMEYIGNRNSGLDGVINMVDKYERLGYQLAHQNTRYQLTQFNPVIQPNKAIIPLQQINFDLLTHYDRRHFPAKRSTFLKHWINQPHSKSLGYMENGTLQGYGVIRACQKGFKIGPLFADTPAIANELFLNLSVHAKGQALNLDIPENNADALNLVSSYNMSKIFATARMYLKGQPQIEMQNIYGITSFELG